MEKKYSFRTVAVCCAVSAVLAALVVLGALFFAVGRTDGVKFLNKVDSVRGIIARDYVGDADWNAIADGAADGMIQAVGDKWSYYMTAEEYDSYKDYSSNTGSGIGVTVKTEDTAGGFVIQSVVAASPAGEAGLTAGETIVSVAGEDIKGLTAQELRTKLQAQTGDFELGLLEKDGSSRTVSIHVGTYYANPVEYKMLDNGIGYVRIVNFEQGAAENAKSAVNALRDAGAVSLVFDVRSNPGGRLDELISLLDFLLPEGDLFISVGKDGKEQVYTSDAGCVQMPMAVLINADSYSAAEFFAAALSEYGYAGIVGEASTGKGRSQVTYELSDGSAVHISTRRYLTPHRVDLAAQGGLTPDVIVQNSTEGDAQLDAAVKYLS